jgi:3-oxoacyl-[acyl-carrier protein] reductase
MSMKINDIKFDFTDKTAIVVGGSRGIGKEICLQFVNANANVFCISRTNPNLKRVNHIYCDLQNTEQVKSIFNQIDEVDFLINVAGTNLCKPIENISIEEWDRLMNVNLKSFYILSKDSLKIMKAKSFGRIVNVSSIAGRHKSLVSGVHYTASKYGIIGLTKQLANEVSKHNILVNCLCPSQTKTEMLEESMNLEQIKKLEEQIPIGRIASVREQAIPVLFLCSSGSSYMTGAAIDVNGGQF